MTVAMRTCEPIVEYLGRRKFNPRAAAERLFQKPANDVDHAVVAAVAPRILEDVSKDRIEAAVEKLVDPIKSTAVSTVVETEHEKVFRLVGEQKFEEAAKLAARLINSGNGADFLVYGHTADYRRTKLWFDDMVKTSKRSVASMVHAVTPELAQILIVNNDGNRKVNAGALAVYMRDIASDRWQLNGSSFALAKDGRNNDGQHRAFAILLTGRSIKSNIVFGLARETMTTVDIGRKRTGADRLGIAGVGDYIKKAAIAAMAFEIYNGRQATAAEAQDYFLENQEIIERASGLIGSNMRGVGPSAAGCAAQHLLRLGFDAEEIRKFFVSVRSGEMLSRNDPRMTLHRAIFVGDYKLKLSRDNWFRAIVHHFIAVKEGRRPTEVQFSKPVPEIA